MRLRHVGAGTLVALLTACAVGPNYKRPPVATPLAYKEVGDWKPTQPADALSRGPWWEIFQDPVLSDLMKQVEISNQNLKQAEDEYDQARYMVSQARAGFWPTVSATFGREREQLGAAPPVTGDTLQGTASWELDIWGQIRRTVEVNATSAQASAAAVADARLSMQATLATDYFELRAQDELKRLLDQTVADEQRSLTITENRYKVGVAARADVVTAQTQLLSSQAQQINAGILRATLEHAIAVLVGKPPADFSLSVTGMRSDVPTVPSGVPSTLLERRPDVAEAERKMASANAQVGVATAAYFPSLDLAAQASYTSSTLSHLFSVPTRIWTIGPELAETLFDGGLRRAETAEARAAYNATVDGYRQTVLSAFQQVEDDVATLRILEQQAVVEDQTVKAAKEAEALTLNQYKAGTVPYSSVITAQTTTFASEQTALSVLESRLTTSIAMIEALGGGWSSAQLPKP